MHKKNDSTLEVTCRRTLLAHLTKWYVVSFNRNPRSKSDLLRAVLEEAERSIIESGITMPIETIDEANVVLEEAGLSGLNRYNRGAKGLALNMRTDYSPRKVMPSQEDIIREARKFLSNPSGETVPTVVKPSTEAMESMIIPKNEDYSIENLKKNFSAIPENLVIVDSGEQSELDKSNVDSTIKGGDTSEK